jgi:hypothetical protein
MHHWLKRVLPASPGGPLEISVNKAHVIGFEAVATLRRIELSQPWVVTLPTPTRTFFWLGESMQSFQGPVTLPENS